MTFSQQDVATKVELLWKESLKYRNFVLSNIDVDINSRKMVSYANRAHSLIKKNNLTSLVGDDYSFLGQTAEHNQKYNQAWRYYQQALSFFTKLDKPRAMETKAFISVNLVYRDQTNEGILLAAKTFQEMEIHPLKQQDYYVWVIWISSIFPRLISALCFKQVNYDRRAMKIFLEITKRYLNDPEHLELHDKPEIQSRLEEIKRAEAML